MQASMVRERVKASEGESDLYSSVSSANIWWETEWWLITSERGWVYRMKRIGPKTEPWGTPQVRSGGEDFIPFTVTTCVLSCRQERKKERARSRIPKVLSRWVRRMLWSIVSKAALRSRRVRIEIDPESEAVRRSFKTLEIRLAS